MLISNISTVTDEAFCILVLENNTLDYHKAVEEQRTITRKESKTKCTKGGISMKYFKG